jgi:hypothetical protein
MVIRRKEDKKTKERKEDRMEKCAVDRKIEETMREGRERKKEYRKQEE